MTQRQILQAFEQYQKSRTQFVQTIAELASRPQNIETLQNAGVMGLLRPLLLDTVPSVQQSAALALGRLANYSSQLAEAVVNGDILPQLVYSLAEQNRFYKKVAAFVLRAVAKHNPKLAHAVVDCGALDALVICLEEFDAGVKESASWALGYVARHNAELAQAVVDAGAVPLLVLCIQEPETSLKCVATSVLADIGKHSVELAQTVVDTGAVVHLAQQVSSADVQLACQTLGALSQLAKHSVELAELVVEAEVFPALLKCLQHGDSHVRKSAATLARELAKHTPELAQLIVNAGGLAALVDCVGGTKGAVRLPAVMCVGFVAAHSERLAMGAIVSNALPALAKALDEERETHLQAAVCWTVGQIGRHTPEHAKAVAQAKLLPKLLDCMLRADASDDLQQKAKRALKNTLQKCVQLEALQPLMHDAPAGMLKYVVAQLSKILPNDPKARKSFVTSGGLQKLLQLKAEPGTALADYISVVSRCFPEEIVKFYSPGYAQALLERVEAYQSQP